MKLLWICLQASLLSSLLSTTNANRKWLEESPLEEKQSHTVENHKEQETYNAVNEARGRQLLDSNSVGKTSKVEEKPAFNLPNDKENSNESNQPKPAFNLPNDKENSNESNQPNYISGTGHDEGSDKGNTEEINPYIHYRGSTVDNHHQITIDDFRRVYHNPGSHP
ncbi:hypothetical protein AMTRI_Chr07g29500 [Amborella trichopoda]|uniref:Phytosulfokine-beta n=1 Tax=Amborella trichopoda TaxID=13333 RepID=W1NGF6_AMBTC|nr:hypothetical protein AMTR_s00009p00123320 [Amborella trichopoda]